jgi:hypothetical protein
MRQAMVEAKAPVPGRRGVLDLEAQFAFFRSQHRHPVNAAAHALLSWPILFTNLLILHFLPLPSPLDPALALALAYAATYVAVDRRAGVLAGILFLGAWAASRALAERLGSARSWRLVLATQLFCWTWQFLGHGLFEASSDSIEFTPSLSSLPVPIVKRLKIVSGPPSIPYLSPCFISLCSILQKKGPTVSELPAVFLMEPFLIFLQVNTSDSSVICIYDTLKKNTEPRFIVEWYSVLVCSVDTEQAIRL